MRVSVVWIIPILAAVVAIGIAYYGAIATYQALYERYRALDDLLAPWFRDAPGSIETAGHFETPRFGRPTSHFDSEPPIPIPGDRR